MTAQPEGGGAPPSAPAAQSGFGWERTAFGFSVMFKGAAGNRQNNLVLVLFY